LSESSCGDLVSLNAKPTFLGMRSASWTVIVSASALVAAAGQARAQEVGTQEVVTQQAAPKAEVSADANSELPRLDERTALMLGARRLKLGILAFEYGITNRMTIGTDPPVWAARAFLPVLVPNLHFKYQFYGKDGLALMGSIAGYYASLSKLDTAASALFTFPLSLFASVRLAPRVWLHGEGTYVFARATGAGDVDRADFRGAVSTRAGQAGAMLEWRLTKIFSLTATGRYQFYAADLAFRGGGTSVDEFTTVDVQGQLTPRVKHPWQAVGGIAVLWRHFHLIAGAGYGYYFIPGLDIAVPTRTVIPDVSLSVVL
jgi:hypothetical protein